MTTQIVHEPTTTTQAVCFVVDSWDDGKGSHAPGYSLPSERTPERRQRITNQVRRAADQEGRQLALDAAYNYDPILFADLGAIYPVWRLLTRNDYVGV